MRSLPHSDAPAVSLAKEVKKNYSFSNLLPFPYSGGGPSGGILQYLWSWGIFTDFFGDRDIAEQAILHLCPTCTFSFVMFYRQILRGHQVDLGKLSMKLEEFYDPYELMDSVTGAKVPRAHVEEKRAPYASPEQRNTSNAMPLLSLSQLFARGRRLLGWWARAKLEWITEIWKKKLNYISFRNWILWAEFYILYHFFASNPHPLRKFPKVWLLSLYYLEAPGGPGLLTLDGWELVVESDLQSRSQTWEAVHRALDGWSGDWDPRPGPAAYLLFPFSKSPNLSVSWFLHL